MNISNDNPSVDPIEYITKQLPKDLVQLLQVRDELAKRQGALNAVEDAAADRAKAKAEMEAAQAEALAVRADAKRFLDEAKTSASKVASDAEDKMAEAVKALREAVDRKSTRLNSSHIPLSRMPSSA